MIRPAVLAWGFWFLAALIMLTRCYSVPVIAPVNTTQVQAQTAQAVRDLDNASSTGQVDNGLLTNARSALSACGKSLEETTASQNKCAETLATCKTNYDALYKKHGPLAEFESGILTWWHWLIACIALFLIGTFFGQTILAILWGAIKGALRIP